MSKELTEEQVHVALSYINAVEMALTGVWPAISQSMQDEAGIDDPEEAVEDLRQALTS